MSGIIMNRFNKRMDHTTRTHWRRIGGRALSVLLAAALAVALFPAEPAFASRSAAPFPGTVRVSEPAKTVDPVSSVLAVDSSLALALTQTGELYRLDTDAMRWSAVTGLPAASPQALALLPDGKVLVIAGKNEEGYHTANAIYDPDAGSFRIAASLPGYITSFPSMKAVTLTDGRVLLVGHSTLYGQKQAFAYSYDPAEDRWTTADKLAYAAEELVRNHRGDVLNYGGGLNDYFPGGTLFPADGGEPRTISSLPYQLRFSAATALADGTFFLAGGSAGAGAVIEPSRAVLVFLPDRNEWHVRSFMKETRAYPAAALLPDGRVLVAGGLGETGRLATSEIYDPATDRWTAGPKLSRAYDHLRLVQLPGGDVLAVGSRFSEAANGYQLAAERIPTGGTDGGKPAYDLNGLPVNLRGIAVHRETLFRHDGWMYRSEYRFENDHNARFYYGDVVYTRAYLTRTNERSGRTEIVIDGRHAVLRLDGDLLYVMQDGYLKQWKLGERYGRTLRYPKSFRVDDPRDPRWSVLGYWDRHAGMPIRLGMDAFDGEYLYTWWSTPDALHEPGYPIRVHYTGSHLQVLSLERGTAYRGELRLDGDWVTYLAAKPDAREWSRNQPHILHAVKKDGSEEKRLAAVFGGYRVHEGHIYYTSADDPLDSPFPAGKLYRMKLDGSDKRLLSGEGAGQLYFVGDKLYFETFETGVIYRMNPDGSEKEALLRSDGTIRYSLLEVRPNALIYNKYARSDIDEWLGTYRMDLTSGKVTAHDRLETPLRIRIDGVYRHFGQDPVMRNGTVLVPLRGILEALGAEVRWDGATRTVTAEKDGVHLRITEGDVFVNGTRLSLAQGPVTLNGTTLVPARVIGEVLNREVTWVGKEQTVNILMP